jgi:hypothetical protein
LGWRALHPGLRRRPRENGEGVDGGRSREDTGPCQAGSGCGGDARRVARGSGGGGVPRRRTWPELAVDAPTTSTAWSWAGLGACPPANVVVHLDRGKAREVEGGEVEPVDMGGRAEDEGGEGEHGMAGMPLAWPWLGHVLPFP